MCIEYVWKLRLFPSQDKPLLLFFSVVCQPHYNLAKVPGSEPLEVLQRVWRFELVALCAQAGVGLFFLTFFFFVGRYEFMDWSQKRMNPTLEVMQINLFCKIYWGLPWVEQACVFICFSRLFHFIRSFLALQVACWYLTTCRHRGMIFAWMLLCLAIVLKLETSRSPSKLIQVSDDTESQCNTSARHRKTTSKCLNCHRLKVWVPVFTLK